ncbi:MAG TPA: hypothetical protein VEJ42_04325 [Streptosporangiaceae bacterium]|nr:hypothetical protein [Streptosporangiaceae bacterium]
MHIVTRGYCSRGIAVAALCALVLSVGLTRSGIGRAATEGGGGCAPYVDGTVIPVPCSSASATGGSPGLGDGGAAVDEGCSFVALSPAQAQSLGLSWPPPVGEAWALLDCLGGAIGPGPQAVLVSTAAGAAPVTPEQLLIQARDELRVPGLVPDTAPPPGSDGLVGLPEWFWIPAASWHPLTVTVTAGPVWATVTATPAGLSFDPGTGAALVTCPGPGSAYDQALPAADQHTECSYTYAQPSAGRPGNAYLASVSVVWQIVWTGSGGAGGVLAPALSVPVSVPIRVAQAEALVTGS